MSLTDADRRRFERLARLYGEQAVESLANSRVALFGLGGVGSFTAEALVRCAVGDLTVIDFDTVAESNINRQLPALATTVGRAKAEVLAERLQAINPGATITAWCRRYSAEAEAELLSGPFDVVVDCIDSMSDKAHLLASCRRRNLAVISSMGAGGRSDPTRTRLADLSATTVCRLAKDLRKILRRKYGFPKSGSFGIAAVYSEEPRAWPREVPGGGEDGGAKNLIDGTAVFVTGTFGLTAAGWAVKQLAGEPSGRPAADRHGFRKDDKSAG